ncbi:MAG: glycine cleavage system protein GcvH [Syntrophomonadaceae bacterium]
MSCKYYDIPADLLYNANDFWVRLGGDEAIIGMSDWGQGNIGDVLYLELAARGTICKKGDRLGSIESGKWVGNLVAPLSGIILASNPEVETNPRQVNTDAYGAGWLFKIHPSDINELTDLMNAEQYRDWVTEQAAREEMLG